MKRVFRVLLVCLLMFVGLSEGASAGAQPYRNPPPRRGYYHRPYRRPYYRRPYNRRPYYRHRFHHRY